MIRARLLVISLVLILGNINSIPTVAWQPESSLVGLYTTMGSTDPAGYMAFNITISLTLTGFNEESPYYRSAKSEKLVAIRLEFVEQGLVEREVLNSVMATSNATEAHLQNETFIEWTVETTQVNHSFFADNLLPGTNLFHFVIEFEIEFLEETEQALEEITFDMALHIDTVPNGFKPGSNIELFGIPFLQFSILVIAGVSVFVIVVIIILKQR